jgi:hypothetical protein
MHRIPATLLSVLWSKYRPDYAFPVSTHYLQKLMFCLVDDYDRPIRSELGHVFSTALIQESAISIQAMSALLSDTSSIHSSTMRSNILRVYEKCSVNYAFMLPSDLCHFIHKRTDINNAGQISFSEATLDKRGVMNPGKVYETMGADRIRNNKVMIFWEVPFLLLFVPRRCANVVAGATLVSMLVFV